MLETNTGIFNPMDEILKDSLTHTDKTHIKLIPRTKRKSMTIVEKIPERIDLNMLLKSMRQLLHCTGSIKENSDGKYIQFTGDHRLAIRDYFIQKSIVKSQNIIIHGW